MKIFQSKAKKIKGFSLPEVLVSTVIFMLMLGLLLGVYTGSIRSFFKGEDALTSTQDATILMLHLRRDLQRLDLANNASISYLKVFDTGQVSARVDFDTQSATFTRTTTDLSDGGGTFEKGLVRFIIPSRHGDVVLPIQYTYDPAESAIERFDLAGSSRKIFALPRLQDFSLALKVQPEGQAVRDLFDGTGTLGGVKMRQLWFELRLTMQSKSSKSIDIRRTAVSLATNVFPKRANHLLWSTWSAGGSGG